MTFEQQIQLLIDQVKHSGIVWIPIEKELPPGDKAVLLWRRDDKSWCKGYRMLCKLDHFDSYDLPQPQPVRDFSHWARVRGPEEGNP